MTIQMRSSPSQERMNLMHQALDRELELATSNTGRPPRRDKKDFRFVSELDEPSRSTMSNLPNRVLQGSKKTEIGELQRKLMQLQQKISNVDVSSDGSIDEQMEKVVALSRQKLALKQKPDPKPNEDTARFLISQEERERARTRFEAEGNSPSEDEDSEDYEEMQRAVERRKAAQRLSSKERTKETVRHNIQLSSNPLEETEREETDRKISSQTESILRPKYSVEKSNRSRNDKNSVGKKSFRESISSKRSTEKPIPRILARNNSKNSLASNNSKTKARNQSKGHDRSFDRFSEKEDKHLRTQEAELAKDLKKMSNLEKELAHYKRLTGKYKEQLEDYRIMQIEFKELKKNFTKSQLIRAQQKKIIETLKTKIGK